MICPVCEKLEVKSQVDSHGGTSTLLGGSRDYYDEQGVHHFHDINTTRWNYSCSRGHNFDMVGHSPCPAGDYGGMGFEVK